MVTVEKCEICDELTGGSRGLAIWPRQTSAAGGSRIIGENEDHVAIVSAGPLSLGHCLILPRTHCSSMAASAPVAAMALLATLRERLSRSYCRPVLLFEHGAPEGSDDRPCSITHAHWHLLPATFGPESLMIEGFDWQFTESPFVRADREYLLVGDAQGCYWVAYSDVPIPSQALRKKAAEVLGSPAESWDWRRNLSIDLMLATLVDLR